MTLLMLIIGPKRVFGAGALYSNILWAFLIGLVVSRAEIQHLKDTEVRCSCQYPYISTSGSTPDRGRAISTSRCFCSVFLALRR